MLLESAHVIAVEADSVWVETIRKSTCGTCAAQKGCGHGILNKISSSKRNYLQVFSGKLKASHCSVDDHVRISIPEQVIIRGSMVVYMVPLILMLLGASAATSFFGGNSDLLALLGALTGFSLGVALVRWHAWRHRSNKAMQPTLVDFVDPLVESITIA